MIKFSKNCTVPAKCIVTVEELGNFMHIGSIL